MIFALANFSAAFADFNRREWTEEIIHNACDQEKIEVVFADMPTLQGFHIKINGVMYIYLDKNLKGIELLFIFLHELAHVVLHPSIKPVAVNFYNQFESKQEDEAEAVALVALFPTTCLPKLEKLITDDEFLAFLIMKRLEIYKRFSV